MSALLEELTAEDKAELARELKAAEKAEAERKRLAVAEGRDRQRRETSRANDRRRRERLAAERDALRVHYEAAEKALQEPEPERADDEAVWMRWYRLRNDARAFMTSGKAVRYRGLLRTIAELDDKLEAIDER